MCSPLPLPTRPLPGCARREDAITLRGEVDILDAATLFPAFHPYLSMAASGPDNDEMFIMPSVPEVEGERPPTLAGPATSFGSMRDQQDLFTMR